MIGSGLEDFNLGDLLGIRQGAQRKAQERRLLALILQAANWPDLQSALPGFRLPPPEAVEGRVGLLDQFLEPTAFTRSGRGGGTSRR